MFRNTPAAVATTYAYNGGGARSVIGSFDDKNGMQSGGDIGGMKGETFGKAENFAYNYGFSAVPAKADKPDQDGNMDGAEGLVQFLGSNRSIPIIAGCPDRRHRQIGMEEGDSCMHGLREWGHQFAITKDGLFMTGNTQKKIRLALTENTNQQSQQGGGGGASPTQLDSGSGGQGGQGQGQGKTYGQKTLHKGGSSSFFDVNPDNTDNCHATDNRIRNPDDTAVQCTGGNAYVGGLSGKAAFAKILTVAGPSVNGLARIG